MIETEDIRLSQERLAALKELITPIKDLAKNWNIDISAELEKYMMSFETNSADNNFAEAAMVVQGTAGIWSKKVEFLYSLVLDSRSMLEEKQINRSHNDDGNAENESDDQMMVLAPVTVKKATNTTINLATVPKSEHFKPKIPLCLSALSLKNNSEENLLYNKKGEVLASRDDFMINTCIIHRSGFASLDIQSFYLLNTMKKAMTPFYKRTVSRFGGHNEVTHLGPDLIPDDESEQLVGPVSLNQPDLVDNEDHHELPGALDISDNDDDMPIRLPRTEIEKSVKSPNTPHNNKTQSRVYPTRTIKSDVPPMFNKVRQRLDPYETTKDKPFRKAELEKPKSYRKRKKTALPNSTLSDVIKTNNSKSAKFTNILRKPNFPENVDLFKKMQSKEKAANTRLQKKLVSKHQQLFTTTDLLKPPIHIPQQDDDDDLPVDLEDDFHGEVVECNGASNVEDLGNQSHLEILESRQRDLLQETDVKLSYRDMVKDHVEQYTREAQHHFRVSELRERVIEWENNILPILEEEEKAKPFDICFYSNKIINKLSDCDNHEATFSNLVHGESRSEVCRMFLTSLMLTNSENIKLQADEYDTKCSLISTALFSDLLEGYVAPSNSAGQSGRKRVHNEVT